MQMENLTEKLYDDFDIGTYKEGEVALLCIDLQYYDCAPGFGFFKDVTRDSPQFSYYFDRLEKTVFPSVRKLQKLFREKNQEVIHIKIESLTEDGRDRSPGHKRIGCYVQKGSKEAEFIDEVAPAGDEIVITKTASGVFNSTNIDYVLRNLGVKQLVVVGVLTNECVDTTVRDGADRGYQMSVIKEGVAASSKEIDEFTLNMLDGVFASVLNYDEFVENFQKI